MFIRDALLGLAAFCGKTGAPALQIP